MEQFEYKWQFAPGIGSAKRTENRDKHRVQSDQRDWCCQIVTIGISSGEFSSNVGFAAVHIEETINPLGSGNLSGLGE